MLSVFRTTKLSLLGVALGILLIPKFAFCSNVLINNSLAKDDEGSLLEVDSITTKEGVKARYRLRIYPGETKELSSSDLLGFQVSRVFDTHKLRYEVTCEETKEPELHPITFNVSMIHEGNLGSECNLTGYGHWSRRTGLNWMMKKKSILDKYKTKR